MTDSTEASADEFTGQGPFEFDTHVRESTQLIRRRLRGSSDPVRVMNTAANVYEEVEDHLHQEAERTWSARGAFETSLGLHFTNELRALDTAIGVSQSSLRLVEEFRTARPPDAVAYAVSSVGTHACSTAHEIGALLRAGFANGARARWRTLHEVDVNAAVLAQGNQWTASRFNQHRWVMLARDRDHQDPRPPWTGAGPSPEVMRERLKKRYGDAYAQPYGWAAELTTRLHGVRKPRFHNLEAVAALMGHDHRVAAAHHRVHADSVDLLNLVDRSGRLHPGASLDGIAGCAWETIRALGEAMDSLTTLWAKTAPSPSLKATQAFLAEVFVDLERGAYQGAVRAGEADPVEVISLD